MDSKKQRILTIGIWLIILGTALFLRTGGMFRGLKTGAIYHPDSPKQVYSYHNYLNFRYIWYEESHFMNGYPLALNHVDEWLTRPLYLGTEKVSDHLFSEKEPAKSMVSPYADYYPNSMWLFYWTRILRLFYSLLMIISAYWLARWLNMSHAFGLLAAFMMAIIPLELVVSHAVTGDIGVDIFAAFLFLAMARYCKNPSAWFIFLAGIMGGFAFASKYHGLLVSGSVGLFLLINYLVCTVNLKKMLLHGLLYAISLLMGIVVATPQFFINAKKTRRMIFMKFEFMKNYKVPPEILEKPFVERAILGFQKNFFFVLDGLGYLVVLLAVIGMVVSVILLIRRRRAGKTCSAVSACRISIFVLPFACILFSLAGKYNVQPFHFSYLILPLVMAAVWLLNYAWVGKTHMRVLAVAIAVVLVVSTAAQTGYEFYFWSRQDSCETQKYLTEEIMDFSVCGDEDHQIIKRINTEDDNLAMFRNRIREMTLPNGSFWNGIEMAPVPSVPFPSPLYWIYDNGPIYPRNDHMFTVTQNDSVEKCVVFIEPPQMFKLGLRTGVWPARVTVFCGDKKVTLSMPPNTQQIIELPLEAVEPRITGSTTHPDAWSSVVKVRTRAGAVWGTVLTSEKEENYFTLFGGAQAESPAWFEKDLLARADEIATQVNVTRYYDDHSMAYTPLSAGHYMKLLDFDPLGAGIYTVQCEVIVDQPDTTLEFSGCTTFAGNDWTNTAWHNAQTLQKGLHVIEHTFEKTFLPYQYHLALNCPVGAARVIRWSVKPDTKELLKSIGHWMQSNEKPAWSYAHDPAFKRMEPNMPYGILFGKSFELNYLDIPEQRGDQGDLTLFVSMNLINPAYRHMEEAVIFIHLEDEQGETRGIVGFPAYQAVNSEKLALPIKTNLNQPVQGKLKIRMGMYSSRTLERLSVQTPDHEKYPVKRDKISLGYAVFE